MTIDQLNKLTDEEVRVRVALQMGYRLLTNEVRCTLWPCQGVTTANSGFMISPAQDALAVQPEDYLKDLNAAFTLVEKLRGEWNFDLTFESGEWTAEFYAIKCFYSTDHTGARHANPARAICLAFLAVTEREEG